ncbi:MAG: transketolase [Bacillota bacterium]
MVGKARDKVAKLKRISNELRKAVIDMIYRAGSGHPGGSLSAADIVATLYFDKMRIDPSRPDWEDRDRFIASKGHAAPVIYAVLARLGFFSKDELQTFRQVGSILQGHPDMLKTPGIDMTSGSLGQGLSCGIGMALAARLSGRSYYVYVLLGDGELNEGQIWEAAMAAVKYRVSNLVAICDWNGLQLDGPTDEVMPMGDLPGKWRSFGWNVIEVDGHDVSQISEAIDRAKSNTTGPTIIMARTVKGKGVCFMENNFAWHGKPLGDADYMAAMAELEEVK